MSAIEVTGLRVVYGDVVAVDGIDLTAASGEVLALLGPNGAGKTSTVETLEGYRSRSAGSVSVLGLDPAHEHAALAPRVGVMLQRGGIYPGMGPAEALALFAAYYDAPLDPAALLRRVGLAAVARTPWRRLSGGEQQRLSLALALVGRPEVAFLDEPTAGVDPQGRRAIRDVISSLRDDGVCVVLTTHELEEAERLADRVVIVDHGRVVAAGTPTELMTRTAGREIRFAAPGGIDTPSLSARLGATVTEASPGEYIAATEATPAAIAVLATWLAERDLPLADLRAGRERLEDVFLRLTADSPAADRPDAAGAGPAGAVGDRGRRRTRRQGR
jgi:ABC-2 type transport system ATP-binding protein